MKNIFKLSLIPILTVMIFSSCAVDDDPEIIVSSKNVISASLSPSNFQTIPQDATEYDLMINFSEALPDFARLSYTVDGQANTLDVNSGMSSAAITLDYSTEDYHEVELTSFSLINAHADNNNPQIIETEKEARLLRENTGIASLTWDNDFYDLDLYIFEMNLDFTDWVSFITGSAGTTNMENFSFSDADILADTNYSIAIFDYWGDADGQLLMLNVIFPDGQIVEKEITVSEDQWYEVHFTKSVDDNGTPADTSDDITTYNILN